MTARWSGAYAPHVLTFHETPTPCNLARVLLDRMAAGTEDIERLRGGIDVLELGCGRGAVLMTLAAAFPRSSFTGLDRSREAIADAVRHAQARRLGTSRFVASRVRRLRSPLFSSSS